MQQATGRADPAAERESDAADDLPSVSEAPWTAIDPSNPAARSHHLDVCPFLQAEHGNRLEPPVEAPDGANRCVAVGAPTPQSTRQQALVCLTAGHSDCPLYHHGALARAVTVPKTSVERGPSTPVIGAALALVLAAAASVGFLLVRGGLTMPVAAVPPSAVTIVSQAPASAPVAIVTPTSTPTAIPTASPSPTAAPTPSPTAVPTPSPAATHAPTPNPAPTSDRYALLEPCPGTKNCWIYTVRSGDNLRSIVNYFGVPYETVLDMNPQIGDPTTIRAGDEIRMPPPTR